MAVQQCDMLESASMSVTTPTYDIEREVAVAADLSGSVAGTTVVEAIVVWAGVPQG